MRSLTTALIFSLFPFVGLSAEKKGESPKLNSLVSLTKKTIEYKVSTGKVKIMISGKTKLLPTGAKVSFELQYYYTVVGKGIGTVSENQTFKDVEIKQTMKLPPDKGYEIRGYIRIEDQIPTLKETIKKVYEKNQVPLLLEFALGNAVERKAANAKTIKFIKGILADAIKSNNKLVDAVAAAGKGTDYNKAGQLDTKKWRKFIDNDLRPKIIAIQKKYAKWIKDNPAYKFRYASGNYFLKDFLNTLGFRSVLESRNLYKKFKLPQSFKDSTLPPDLKISTSFSIKTAEKARLHLIDCYKKIVDPMGFNLIPKKKKPAAKKEVGKKKGSGSASKAKPEGYKKKKDSGKRTKSA